MNEQSDEDLAVLAARINRNYALGEKAERQGLPYYLRVGEDLLEAKEKVEHGQWGAWVEENFPFSGQRARQLMKLARAAKTLVTSDLEALVDAWRRIQGNDPPDDELEDGPEEVKTDPPTQPPPEKLPEEKTKRKKARRPEQAPPDNGQPIPIRTYWIPSAAAVRYMEWLKKRHEGADEKKIIEEALREKCEEEGMPVG
jgi:hypothetical protein